MKITIDLSLQQYPMTFYNPNVQSHFEADQPDYSVLKGLTFAVIDFIFSSPGQGDRAYTVTLNDQVLQNYLGEELSCLLAELVYRCWQGSIVTPADFIRKQQEMILEESESRDFYQIHLMKILIEKLILESGSRLCPTKPGLYKLIFQAQAPDTPQGMFSLYERLKLIDFLLHNLHFRPDARQMRIQDRKHYLKVIVSTK